MPQGTTVDEESSPLQLDDEHNTDHDDPAATAEQLRSQEEDGPELDDSSTTTSRSDWKYDQLHKNIDFYISDDDSPPASDNGDGNPDAVIKVLTTSEMDHTVSKSLRISTNEAFRGRQNPPSATTTNRPGRPKFETADSYWMRSSRRDSSVATEALSQETDPAPSSGASTSVPAKMISFVESQLRNSRRKRRVILIGALVVVAIVAVVSTVALLAGRSSSSPSQGEDNKEPPRPSPEELGQVLVAWQSILVQDNISSSSDFVNPNSPQSQALNWLVFQDRLLIHDDWNRDHVIQRYVLAVLSFACGGTQWVRVGPSWTTLVDQHECDWGAVECTSDLFVRTLSLSNVAMVGSLPKEVGSLKQLERLIVDNNRLEGKLPDRLFRVSSLVELHLMFNEFVSTLSPEIGNLVNLEYLSVENNRLSGTLPEAMVNMTSLNYVGLSQNFFEGPLFDFAMTWPRLAILRAQFNDFVGTLPSTLHLLSDLEELDLWSTKVTGSIPTKLCMLRNLARFRFGFSSVDGTIPNEIGDCSNMVRLTIAGSRSIVGTLPTTLGLLTLMEGLQLSKTSISGTIPSELGNLLEVTDLILDTNKLTGSIPTEIGRLTKLLELRVFHNQLTGEIPPGVFQSEFIQIERDCQVSCCCCHVTCHL